MQTWYNQGDRGRVIIYCLLGTGAARCGARGRPPWSPGGRTPAPPWATAAAAVEPGGEGGRVGRVGNDILDEFFKYKGKLAMIGNQKNRLVCCKQCSFLSRNIK